MKAPITGNSITERVQFTGLYIPDEDESRDAERSPAGQDVHEANGADESDVARVA